MKALTYIAAIAVLILLACNPRAASAQQGGGGGNAPSGPNLPVDLAATLVEG